jgi:catechol 2,3-dioxygenase-like lactoylglutathione lyase family enzyme/uncharacterized glyoxalase superfamily protein PhnB
MKRLTLVIACLALLSARPVAAQLVAPNEMGVAMGQVQLVVQDLDATKQFWTSLGGSPGKLANSSLEYAKFPGVLIFWRKGEPTGGSVGSVLNHLGFKVKDMSQSMARWKAAGLKTEPGQNAGQAYVTTPDGLVRIEILEDKSLSAPMAFDHIHFFVQEGAAGGPTIAELQAWYAKAFGATPTKRAQFEADVLPGVTIMFSKSDMPVVPTRGRGLDRIGFEIKDLEGFCKKATDNGLKLNGMCRTSPTGIWVGGLTDPVGTTIELNEGLAAL